MGLAPLEKSQVKQRSLGGYSSEVPPLPIPNREVKLTNADGTAYLGGRVGSRLFKPNPKGFGFLFVVTALPKNPAFGGRICYLYLLGNHIAVHPIGNLYACIAEECPLMAVANPRVAGIDIIFDDVVLQRYYVVTIPVDKAHTLVV